MAAYTYYAADLMTGQLLDEIPLSDVSFTLPINDAGTLSATVPLYARSGLAQSLATARTALYVDRDGVLVWGGVLWARRYAAQDVKLEVSAMDFLSYLDHLLIVADLQYTGIDQLAIARALVAHGMQQGQSDLGLQVLGATTSAVLRDRTYLAADNTFIGQALRELSAADQGFDFRFSCRWDGDLIRRTVEFAYPKFGRPQAQSGLVFDYSVDAIDWSWDEDGTSSANVVYSTGVVSANAPANTQPPRYTADAPEVRAAGMPRLAAVVNFGDVTQPATVQALAQGQLNAMRLPLITSSATVRLPFTGYTQGDEVLCLVPEGDALFRYGANVTAIITDISVAVSEEFAEQVSLTLQPTAVAELSPAPQIDRLRVGAPV